MELAKSRKQTFVQASLGISSLHGDPNSPSSLSHEFVTCSVLLQSVKPNATWSGRCDHKAQATGGKGVCTWKGEARYALLWPGGKKVSQILLQALM